MFEHIILALIMQTIVARLLSNWTAGAFAAAAWAIAREITQAEYRWIEHYGGGLRANMPWWGGFDARVWQSVDPWLDWALPTLAVAVVAVIAARISRGRETPA